MQQIIDNNLNLFVEDPLLELEQIFEDIFTDRNNNVGFHKKRHIINHCRLINNTKINNLLSVYFSKKLIIMKNVYDNTFSAYIQLWNDYKNFCYMILSIVYILNNKEIINKLSKLLPVSFFSIILENTFADIANILSKNQDKKIFIQSYKILKLIENFKIENKYNILEIIQFVEPLTLLKDSNILTIINTIYSRMFESFKECDILNAYLNELLIQNNNSNICKISKNINNLIDIIKLVNTETMIISYRKFFQMRILRNNTCLEIEQEIINKCFKNNAQIFNSNIADIIFSRSLKEKLNNNIEPYILDKKSWIITNNASNDKIIFPHILQNKLNIIEQHLSKEKCTVKWNYALGSATFKMKNVNIKCNMYQAILIVHLNEYPKTTVKLFSEKSGIPKLLCEKIFQSLNQSNLLISNIVNNTIEYHVNKKCYERYMIDLRKEFLKVFEKEIIE